MLKTRLTERKHRFAQVTKLSIRPKWFTGGMVEGGGQNIKITYIVCGTYIYKKNVTCYITHALTKLRFAVQETKKTNRIIIKITMIRLEKNVKNENKKEY